MLFMQICIQVSVPVHVCGGQSRILGYCSVMVHLIPLHHGLSLSLEHAVLS